MRGRFRIGTYNVENLFDRFDDPYSAGDDPWGRYRTSPKPRAKLYDLGQRIRQSRVDILGMQELENFGALKDFVQGSVGPAFKVTKGIVSQQSNDSRGIDLGLLSSLPLGRIISHRFNEFPTPEGKTRRFSRDCVQVEVLDRHRTTVLVTVFVCHFKSKYSRFDPVSEKRKYQDDQKKSDDKREGEANEVVRIIQSELTARTDRFVVLGDLNDTPESQALAVLTGPNNSLGLVNGTHLTHQPDTSATSATRRPRDTHCWSRDKKKTWSQIDYILVSPTLWKLNTGHANVLNRPQDQGSDHYLSWVEFNAPSGLSV